MAQQEEADRVEQEADEAARRSLDVPAGPGSGPLRPTDHAEPGRPLGSETRERFERSFGWDFSAVSVERGPAADEATAAAGAKALTAGRRIQVSSRVGDPEGGANQALLAHELAHVVQQDKARGESQALGPGVAGGLSPASPGPRAAPVVTAINIGPGEVGVGKSLDVVATAAGSAPLTWTLVGAPPGVTVAPTGLRRARITAPAPAPGTPPAGAGTGFQVTAALTATPADSATSGTVTLVGITSVSVAANPPFAPVAIAGGGTQAPPANALDPNRDGLLDNTGVVTVVTAPAGRPVTVRLPAPMGSTVAGTTITPGSKTGLLRVRVEDNATRSRVDTVAGSAAYPPVAIDAVPTRVSGFGPQGGPPAGVYGPINPIRFAASDPSATSATMTRVVGETITAGGSDAFGLMAQINLPTGPNPAPVGNLSAPANGWNDQLFTGIANIDVNQFVGPRAPGGPLPAVWTLRQGFHNFSWTGVRYPNEIDRGVHRRSLIQQGNTFRFLTEHEFPGAKAPKRFDPYGAANPLIRFTNITLAAAAPAAVGGLAADGQATANVTAASTVAGRLVTWNVVSGPVSFTVGGAAPIGVAGPATLQAGLVPGKFRVTVVDSVLPNRRAEGTVMVLPVRLRGLTAAPAVVPAGTNATTLTVNADPGGRTVQWRVDPAAIAAGVAAPVPGPVSPAVAATAVLTRPAGFTGTVTVTAVDSVLPAKRASIKVRFQ